MLEIAGDGCKGTSVVVIAATHDQELVDLLRGLYVVHNFTDSIDAEGLTFDYKLYPGAATTRNAIALLGQRGAPADVVVHALERARGLDAARQAGRGQGSIGAP
jgi:DNA mismatch repair ATPase MutS